MTRQILCLLFLVLASCDSSITYTCGSCSGGTCAVNINGGPFNNVVSTTSSCTTTSGTYNFVCDGACTLCTLNTILDGVSTTMCAESSAGVSIISSLAVIELMTTGTVTSDWCQCGGGLAIWLIIIIVLASVIGVVIIVIIIYIVKRNSDGPATIPQNDANSMNVIQAKPWKKKWWEPLLSSY